mmetsp:Transcript_4087/g.7243  ORF Transcript_4087/g.7243 Transcript_4087/m.7243 type:complete len:81 (-) Transcript_4087:826-1068(-)
MFVAINIETHPASDANAHPTGDWVPCDRVRHVTNENKLNHTSNFGNSFGSDSGDSRLMMMSEQFVTVNAISMPAETKSSR